VIALLEFARSKHESILKKIRGFFCAMKIRDQYKKNGSSGLSVLFGIAEYHRLVGQVKKQQALLW